MTSRWRGVLSRHPRVLGVFFAAYWLAMFLATHIKLPKVDSAPQNTDKVVHLVMYAGFAFLLCLWLSTRRPWTRNLMLIVLAAAIGYAALDELLQMATETRTAEIWDFVMDLLGAALGLLLFWAVRRKYPRFWEPDSDLHTSEARL